MTKNIINDAAVKNQGYYHLDNLSKAIQEGLASGGYILFLPDQNNEL